MVSPTFMLGQSALANLPESLTINSVTKTPTLKYIAANASGTTWTASIGGTGAAMTVSGSGAAPTLNDGAPTFGSGDTSVKINNAKAYLSASSVGDVTTEDIVVEAVLRCVTPASGQYWFAHRATGNGWYGYCTATTYAFGISDGTAKVTTFPVVDSHWVHLIVFVRRAGSSLIYCNGSAGTPINVSAVGSITNAEVASIGANASLTTSFRGNIAYLAMWKGASWLDTHLQASVAVDRFQRLCGVYPLKASGTFAPAIAARAAAANLTKIETGSVRKIYAVASGWMRQSQIIDSGGTTRSGLRIEPQSTNEILQSETFSNASWTKTYVTAAAEATVTAPTGDLVAQKITASADNDVHTVSQAITSADTDHSFSVFVKAGAKSIIKLVESDVANGYAYYNLGTGVVGTVGAGVSWTSIQAYGNGWYRLGLGCVGGTASHGHLIGVCDTGETDSWAGDGSTISCYLWGAQHGVVGAVWTPGSYVATTTASVTRAADQLRYAGNNVSASPGTIECQLIYPTGADIVTDQTIISASDGGASTDEFRLTATASGDVATWTTTASGGDGGSATVATDIANGAVHKIRGVYQTDLVSVSVDGVLSSIDTSADMPVAANIDQLDIGPAKGVLIGGLKLYKKRVK